MRQDAQPEFCYKGSTKVFFRKKLAELRPVAQQTDATQACHRGGPGGLAPSRWAIVVI